MKITDYKVLEGFSATEIELNVQAFVLRGYEIHGSMLMSTGVETVSQLGVERQIGVLKYTQVCVMRAEEALAKKDGAMSKWHAERRRTLAEDIKEND